MFFFSQAYVGLRDDDPFNIWLEEKHLEQLFSHSNPQNAPRLKRIVGHPVLLWLVLEYSLAMVDCHCQPCQGVFARQGLHCQCPVLKSWTQKLNNLCWHSFIGLCFFSVVCVVFCMVNRKISMIFPFVSCCSCVNIPNSS